MLAEATGLEAFDSSVAEVDHADDAHDGEAAAFFLAGMLGVGFLIFGGVHEGDFGSVDGFELVAAPEILGLDAGVEGLFDLLINLNEEGVFDPLSGAAVSAGVASGDWEVKDPAPRLNEAEAFGAAGVGFQELGQPCPEDGEVSKAALARGGVNFCKEGAGENVLENEGVSAKGVSDKALTNGLNRGLRTAFGSGKYGVRKAGEDGLFGHTFKPYPNRLFVFI